MDGQIFHFGGFSNQHTEFFFNFKDELTTTLSQEDQQAPAQTYTPSRKSNFNIQDTADFKEIVWGQTISWGRMWYS